MRREDLRADCLRRYGARRGRGVAEPMKRASGSDKLARLLQPPTKCEREVPAALDEVPTTGVCPTCGRPLPSPRGNYRRRYCSSPCRQKAYRQRRDQAAA
jgi:hypothetical protein